MIHILGIVNIIRYENRPFATVEEMDKALLQNWNSVVSPNDKVWHLGDVCFSWPKERALAFINSLNGRKILILGNHDRAHSISWWMDVGFEVVYDKPLQYNDKYIFSHEPIEKLPNGIINVHGHVHSKTLDFSRFVNKENYINVCVEMINYTPKLLQEVIHG